jgi:hypothetical protein
MMKKTLTFILLMAILPLSAQNHAKKMIQDWPDTAKKSAEAMLDKYGEPDEHTKSMLIWENTGPFTHTIVYKEEIQHDFPMPHKDVLEQIVHYDVPVDKYDELAEFDGSVIVERTRGTMAARCDKEAANILALNLANDVIKGNKTVDEARQFYGDAMMKMLQGEKVEYLKQLTFDLPGHNVTNSDVTTMDMSKVKKLKMEKK